jgi:MFS family permease
MATERAGVADVHAPLRALRNPRILALGLVCFRAVIINYGLRFFLPQIVKGFGLSYTMVGVVSALPYVAALFGITASGYISDRTGNRRGCAAAMIVLCAICLAVSTLFDDPVAKMATILVAGFFMFGYLPAFWAIPEKILQGPALAAGIATIKRDCERGGFHRAVSDGVSVSGDRELSDWAAVAGGDRGVADAASAGVRRQAVGVWEGEVAAVG